MQRTPVTPEGILALRKELKHLKQTERPRISQAIAHARALGDLKEKDEQGLLQARIDQLEDQVSRAQVIDVSKMKNDGSVIFGTTVTLKNDETGKNLTFKIVGESEADAGAGKLSVTAPMVRAVVGKKVDDDVAVNTPSGPVEYTILSVEYI